MRKVTSFMLLALFPMCLFAQKPFPNDNELLERVLKRGTTYWNKQEVARLETDYIFKSGPRIGQKAKRIAIHYSLHNDFYNPSEEQRLKIHLAQRALCESLADTEYSVSSFKVSESKVILGANCIVTKFEMNDD